MKRVTKVESSDFKTLYLTTAFILNELLKNYKITPLVLQYLIYCICVLANLGYVILFSKAFELSYSFLALFV